MKPSEFLPLTPMQCAIIVFLLPIFALVSRVAGIEKKVQLSIQNCAGKNSFATNTTGSPVAKATFLRTNALDSLPFKAMVTLQITPKNKNKSQPVV